MAAIKLRQVQEDPDRKGLFGILGEYIQPDSTTSVQQAAVKFADGAKESASSEEYFWAFWGDVFSIAEQIPHDNPAQDKLAAFIRELTLVPETGNKVWETRVWIDLPLLRPAVREHLDVVTGHERISFHAFLARLWHAGVSPAIETTAIWVLRDALEEDTKPAGDGSAFDTQLAVAAVYIEYAGATIVQKLASQPSPQLDEVTQRSLRGGKLWKGESGLTPARFNFWGSRFTEVAGSTASDGVKAQALHAARLIEVWSETWLSK
ncbi:hypothetical protein GQX73_g6444 [Xylaria multiplex]|uniref:Uncharacterized protein n=1 Tax=Xylaria multiplex TaxID=323545 RepID=A0A7C8MW84_9PEZI|nr:hypothetical protein GQX73_g6444 [Xylaria multiplex]